MERKWFIDMVSTDHASLQDALVNFSSRRDVSLVEKRPHVLRSIGTPGEVLCVISWA